MGPHECNGRIAIVQKFTVTDRYFMLIAIRRASLGDRYSVESKCPECQKIGKFDADLSLLPIRPMKDPTSRTWSGVVPSGASFTAHVMTGEDEAWLAAAKSKLEGTAELTLNLLARVDSWNGEPLVRDTVHRKDFEKSVRTLANLGIRDRSSIRNQVDDVEGNVDLTLDFACSSCGNQWKGGLSLTSKDFFFPSET